MGRLEEEGSVDGETGRGGECGGGDWKRGVWRGRLEEGSVEGETGRGENQRPPLYPPPSHSLKKLSSLNLSPAYLR